MNSVELGGNLTRDVELRRVGHNSTPLATFTIAFNPKPKEGRPKPPAQFFDCKAWGDTAEAIAADAAKGTGIEVAGMLSQETWEDKTTGAKRSKVVVVVFEYRVREGSQRKQPADNAPQNNTDDDDIPF